MLAFASNLHLLVFSAPTIWLRIEEPLPRAPCRNLDVAAPQFWFFGSWMVLPLILLALLLSWLHLGFVTKMRKGSPCSFPPVEGTSSFPSFFSTGHLSCFQLWILMFVWTEAQRNIKLSFWGFLDVSDRNSLEALSLVLFVYFLSRCLWDVL